MDNTPRPGLYINQDAQIEETEMSDQFLLLINQTILNRSHVIVDKISPFSVRVKRSLYHQETSFFFNTPCGQLTLLFYEGAFCGALRKEKHH